MIDIPESNNVEHESNECFDTNDASSIETITVCSNKARYII